MVVVRAQEEGELYFGFNRIVEILRPQSAPDKLLVEFSICFKVGYTQPRW